MGFIVLFILVAGGTSAVYFSNSLAPRPTPTLSPESTPTPDPASNAADATANWKTYSDGVIAFSYPPLWYVQNEKSRLLILPSGKTFDDIVSNKEFVFIIMSETNPKNLSAEHAWNNYVSMNGARNPKYEKTTINGMEAVRTENNSLDSYDIVYRFANEKIITSISLNYLYADSDNIKVTSERFPDAEELFDQILSTFKFTE